MQRRDLLKLLGASGTLGLIDCGGGSDSSGSAGVTSGSGTATGVSTGGTSVSAAQFGSTGWNSVSYVSDAQIQSLSDFLPLPAASYTFKQPNTATGVAETVAVAAFSMGRYQVTNANWKAYCNASNITTFPRYWSATGGYPAGKQNHPVLFLSYVQATQYCAWLATQFSGRTFYVPSEGEWEYAAIGANSTYSYPWGAQPGNTYANGVLTTRYQYNGVCSAYLLNGSGITTLSYYDDTVVTMLNSTTVLTNDTAPVSVVTISASGAVSNWQNDSSSNQNLADFANSDQFEALVNVYGGDTSPVGFYAANGNSWCGCCDMAGNAYEWTATDSVATNGIEAGTTVKNVRGGSWYSTGTSGSSTGRGEGRSPSGGYHSVGFRLAVR